MVRASIWELHCRLRARGQAHATFMWDPMAIENRHLTGTDCLLWGNDYPHHDAIWPHSMETLDKIFVGVPDDERERLCFTNTVKLYDIDVSKLPPE